MRNRSIRQNKFNLPSMRKLWKKMGEYDALVEYNECAIRQFIAKWEQCKQSNQDYSEFIKEQSAEVGIKLGYIDIKEYRQDIYRWYLIHPYGIIDNYVRDFKEDLKVFGFNINLDFDDKSSLEKLISGMKEANIKISVENYKLDVDRYYHRCRNFLAHKLNGKEKQKIERLFMDIDRNKILEIYPTLTDALSKPDVFTFDDFILCTANLKNITDTLTTDVYNAIDWSKYNFSESQLGKKIKKYRHNHKREIGAIRAFIFTNYGVTVDEKILIDLRDRLAQSNNG